jgi:hypothetical protein
LYYNAQQPSSDYEQDDSEDYDSGLLSCEDDEEKENFPQRITVPSKQKVKAKSSWVWEHFKSSPNGDKTKSFCLLCSQDIHYGKSRSTGMLERHIKIKHAAVDSDRCAQRALERIEQETMADK